jgi:hypothetical protein
VCDGFAEVSVFQPSFLFRGRVRDISQSGCFVETLTRNPIPVDSRAELRFTANGERLTSLALVKLVVPGKGVGFEFVAGDPRMDQKFLNLMERLTVEASEAP